MISAVIAVYNPEPALFRQAVASVLSQSLPVLELVLVNDGGSEEFRKVLPDDDRIRIFSKPNEGVAATRNFAIEHAHGDYIALLDQDDFWYPEKLAEQTAMIPSEGQPCMVISLVDVVDCEGRVREKKSLKVQEKFRSGTSGDIAQGLADDNLIHSSSPLVHRDLFRLLGGFDDRTKPHDDWDMYLRIAFAGFPVYAYALKPLSVWRMHDANESHKRMAMMRSKIAVEQKALRAGPPNGIATILSSNLALDRVVIDNLWYNEKEYEKFRESVRRDLPELLKLSVRSGREDRFAGEYRARAVRAIVKSLRRYPLSFFSR